MFCKKRNVVKIGANGQWICRAMCAAIELDTITDVISQLSNVEKRALRLTRLYGQFRRPAYRNYLHYLGTAQLSVNWICWRDVSFLIGINNTYNRFGFINNERVISALQYFVAHNPYYNFESNQKNIYELNNHIENPNDPTPK